MAFESRNLEQASKQAIIKETKFGKF